jgi:hypothetical protein
MPLLPVPVLGSTNWSPWATALQEVVAAHETALAGKAATGHTHEGGGSGGGVGSFDGGGATAVHTSTLDGGGAS